MHTDSWDLSSYPTSGRDKLRAGSPTAIFFFEGGGVDLLWFDLVSQDMVSLCM